MVLRRAGRAGDSVLLGEADIIEEFAQVPEMTISDLLLFLPHLLIATHNAPLNLI